MKEKGKGREEKDSLVLSIFRKRPETIYWPNNNLMLSKDSMRYLKKRQSMMEVSCETEESLKDSMVSMDSMRHSFKSQKENQKKGN